MTDTSDKNQKPGKYDVVDPDYRGYDPTAPQRVVRKENRKRVTPSGEIAYLDPNWSEFDTN